MIHLSRLRDHSRKTMMVSEILPHLDEKGDIRLNPLFEFREDENSTRSMFRERWCGQKIP